jgi:mannose-6-phosphate isomerase-like protein (cupin superfamily)
LDAKAPGQEGAKGFGPAVTSRRTSVVDRFHSWFKPWDDYTMQAFEIAFLSEQQSASGRPYLEFLRVPSMSAGLYCLPAGAADPQQPHTEDEVYYVASGAGQIRVGGSERPVQAGSIVFVPAGVEHHFHGIIEDLEILVFFAPAEYTNRA